MKCNHNQQRTLYERGPSSEGSKFIPAAKKCRRCGALIPLDQQTEVPGGGMA